MKIAEKALLFCAAALLAGGCGYATQGYRYQNVSAAPREFNCPLEILSAIPKAKSKELGFVEFKPRGLGALPHSKEEAMQHAQSFACVAGGNALLVVKNGGGQVTRATILQVEKR